MRIDGIGVGPLPSVCRAVGWVVCPAGCLACELSDCFCQCYEYGGVATYCYSSNGIPHSSHIIGSSDLPRRDDEQERTFPLN